MAKTIHEGYLAFAFDNRWRVEKYDEHFDFRRKIGELQSSKAVDFVAFDGAECLFIEVKDFRTHRIENRLRLSGPLAEEVALKVRDSIAGVIGAHRCSCTPETWAPFAKSIANRGKQLKVILWLEDDTARNQLKWKQKASVLTNVLRKKLAWLTTRVIVMNLQTCGSRPQGISVSNLPHN
jgi:hypothetical protein